MFCDQVRCERQQEQQDDLRRWLIAAPAAEKAQRATVQPTDHKAREDTADRHLKELHRRAADGKHHRAHRHRNGKFQRYQTGGVIHQRLTLQDTHDFLRDPPFTDNTGKRNRIGWRQHGSQRKGRNQRNARHQPVNQKTNPDHGDQHQRQRQTENLSPMFKKFSRWRLPAIRKQQRRDKQDQKQFGVKFYVQTKRGPRQQRADSNLHEG